MRKYYCTALAAAMAVTTAHAAEWQTINLTLGRDDVAGFLDVKPHGDGFVILGSTRSLDDRNALVIRLNADHSLDTDFGNSGYTIVDLFPVGETPAYLQVQSDNSIVIVSNGSAGSAGTEHRFAQLAADGNRNMAFGDAGVATLVGTSTLNYQQTLALTVDADDGLRLCGSINNNGQSDVAFHHLNANGSWDADYGDAGRRILGASDTAEMCETIVVFADGTVLAGGRSESADLPQRPTRYRLDGNGDITGALPGGLSRYEAFEYASPKRLAQVGADSLYWLGYTGLFKTDLDGVVDTDFGSSGLANWLSPLSQHLNADMYVDRIGRVHVVHAETGPSASTIKSNGDWGVPALITNGAFGRVLAMHVDPDTGVALAVGKNDGDEPIIGSIKLLQTAAISYAAREIGELPLGVEFTDDFTIRNEFDTPLTFAISSDSAQVSLTGCSAELQPLAECTGTLRIMPNQPSFNEANLTIANAVTGYSQNVALAWQATGLAQATPSHTSLTFTAPLDSSESRELTLTNNSAFPLQFISISTEGEDFSAISIAGPESRTCWATVPVLAPGQSCNTGAFFRRETAGTSVGLLIIETNADSPVLAIALAGEARANSSGGDDSGGGGGGSVAWAGLLLLFGLQRLRRR